MISAMCSAGLIIIVAILAIRYGRLNRRYDYNRPIIKSDTSFKPLYKPVIVATLLIALAAYWYPSGWLLLIHESPALRVAGIVISLCGLFLFEWSVNSLGAHYSPCFDLRMPSSLVTSGPYKYFRHPMYLAICIVIAGVFMSSGSFWILGSLIIVAGYYWRSARQETLAIHSTKQSQRG